MNKTLNELLMEELEKKYQPASPLDLNATQPEVQPEPQPEPVIEEPQEKLSEFELSSSNVYDEIIVPYMEARWGMSYVNEDREEVVSKFMNNMRGFSGGNTVRAGKELSWLAGVSDEDRVKAGAAYSFVDQDMANLYSSDTTLAEKASGTWDYLRQGVLDPINIVGGFAGKIAGGATFRLGSAAARKAAMNEFRRRIAKGATEKAATKAANKVFLKSSKEASEALAKETVKRNATKGALNKLVTRSGLAEVGAATAVDMVAGAVTDYGYQKAMLKTGAQAEYSELQTFLSGAFSFAAGGISATTVALRGTSGLNLASKATPKPTSEGIGDELVASTKFLVSNIKSWDSKVTSGRQLDEIPDSSFFALINGDEEGGWKGLKDIFAERNLQFTNPDMYENKSDWITDVIMDMPQAEADNFISSFKDITGITKAYDNKDLTLETFADVFARKASDLGKNLGTIRNVGTVLGDSNIEEYTFNDYAKALGLTEGKKVDPRISESSDLQNNLIRGIVSNLGTTALNARGWGLATATNSASDLVQAQMLALTGNTRAASHLIAMQGQKVRNLVDNNTTLEVFLDYLNTRPDVGKAMSREISGGVEQKIKLDFNKSFANQKVTDFVDGVQAINMVYAQDTMTKAQEFMYQLDKNIRLQFDMTYSELLANDDAFKIMGSDLYKLVEKKAVDETERAVFSRSFKDADNQFIRAVARVIEDVRNVPGIGYLAPFGKFFNNSVSNISDHTGITLAMRAIKKNETDTYKARTNQELLARGIVTATAVGFMVPKEIENIENGLDVFESLDETTGEVVTFQYDFPFSYIKAIARLIAKGKLDQEVSDNELDQIVDTLGLDQLTRQLGESGKNWREIRNVIAGVEDAQPIGDIGYDMLVGSVGMLSSGLTRTFEPVNAAIGLALGDAYVNIDKKQGNRFINESLKYLDQVYAVMAGKPLAPEKFSAVGGTRDVDVGKFAGSRGIKMNATKQVLNYSGIADWTIEGMSKVAIADNEFNRAFHSMIEFKSKKLLANKKFMDADQETKKLLARQVFNEARENSIDYISLGLSEAGRPELGLMYKILSKNKRKVAEVLEVLKEKGYPEEVEDFDLQQLNTLNNMVKSYNDFKLQ